MGKVCLTDAASARHVRPVFTQSVNTSHSLGGMEVPTLLAEQAGLAQRQTGATLLKAWLCPRTLCPGRQGPPGSLVFRFGVGFFLHLPIKPRYSLEMWQCHGASHGHLGCGPQAGHSLRTRRRHTRLQTRAHQELGLPEGALLQRIPRPSRRGRRLPVDRLARPRGVTISQVLAA